jgi:UDP-galactopyranose mutase
MYDFLIVGSGLFGSVFAYEANKRGKKCLVIDKRDHIAGNIYTKKESGINVHQYGPHIFNTNSEKIWNYVNQFCNFNNFTYSPIANYKGEYFSLPFNMWTFNQLWGVKTPKEAKEKIKSQIVNIKNPKNLEEWVLSNIGTDIYEKLIYGYTKKQWMKDPKDLPSFIIKRLPVRFTYNNDYYNSRFSGIPTGGYTQIVEKLLNGIETKTKIDFFSDKKSLENISKNIVYTGKIDELFDFKFGDLEYRCLEFKKEKLNIENYQGVAGVNFTHEKVPYTRIIEHKHFEFNNCSSTIITKEFPVEWSRKKEPYYPINDDNNSKLYKKYKDLSLNQSKYILGGRLAEYRYYNMDQVIASSLKKVVDTFGK